MIILGVDPGTVSMGYGVVNVKDDDVALIAFGHLTAPPRLPLAQRLFTLHQKLEEIIQRYSPAEVAIEEPFVADNARTALAVGRAQAIAMLAASRHALPIFSYTPTQVKRAVTSYGASSKEQVQEMVRLHLNLDHPPQPNDAADALAVALCHQRQTHLAHLLQDKELARSASSREC